MVTKQNWLIDAILIIGFGLAVIGIWNGLPILWMTLLVIVALAMWDIIRFRQRLAQADDHQPTLIRYHSQHLLMVLGAGLGLSLIAIYLPLNLSFSTIVGLGLIMMICLGWFVMWLRQM